MKEARIKLLFERYLDRTFTETELLELSDMVGDDKEHDLTVSVLSTLIAETKASDTYNPQEWEPVFEKIIQKTKDQVPTNTGKVIRFKWLRWAAAAVFITLICYGVWWAARKDAVTDPPVATSKDLPQFLPGKDGAILTLANGTQVHLDSLVNGAIINSDGTQLALQNGEVTYDADTPSASEVAGTFHTMSTPKGRHFSLVLPDGTRAWLNAASSITYPVQFGTKERRVEISGEVYFEVAKNAVLPFRVGVKNLAEIEVLGTHFNVNAYEEQMGVKATLLEGAVRVKTMGLTKHMVEIKPGQQALVQQKITVTSNVDLERVMAWKNGLFYFENVSLQEVMAQLTRWYNIDVVYPDGIPKVTFGGKMSRNVPLSDVLKALKGFGISFRMEEDRKLIVMP